MKAYSDDLRIRIVKTYCKGYSIGYIAKEFYVSRSFVSKLVDYYCKTGSVTPNSKLKSYPVPVLEG